MNKQTNTHTHTHPQSLTSSWVLRYYRYSRLNDVMIRVVFLYCFVVNPSLSSCKNGDRMHRYTPCPHPLFLQKTTKQHLRGRDKIIILRGPTITQMMKLQSEQTKKKIFFQLNLSVFFCEFSFLFFLCVWVLFDDVCVCLLSF